MANAAVTDTPITTSIAGGLQHVYGTLAVAAGPDVYVAGGLVLDLTDGKVKASRPPIWVDFSSANGNVYAFIPGTSISNGKLKIMSAANTEIAASAIPATVSGDTIRYHAVFVGQN